MKPITTMMRKTIGPRWRIAANLSLASRDLGRFDQVLEKMPPAETIRKELTKKQPEAHQLQWAYALPNLSEALVNSERPIEAIRTGEQAVTLLPGLMGASGNVRTIVAEGFASQFRQKPCTRPARTPRP
ncbi:MAG: hypothetical protein AAF543_13540 [Pseudomonadota bacterium]